MNITILLGLLFPNFPRCELSAIHSPVELSERLARDAYNSHVHSVRQVYRVGNREADRRRNDEQLPSITLHGAIGTKWPIENAFLIVQAPETSIMSVLEKLLEKMMDVEKNLLVVVLDHQHPPKPSEMVVQRVGLMLFRRGVLNYCFISDTSTPSGELAVSIFKYDVLLKRLLVYDRDTPFEVIFPPFLHSLEGHSVKVLYSDNFPFAFKVDGTWEGNDVFLMGLAEHRFRCRLDRMVMQLSPSNAMHQMEAIQTHLENGTIDMHIPRAHYTRKHTAIGLASAYEWESLVLVVPKSIELNLSNIMLQPFSVEVWTMVSSYLVIKQFFKFLSFVKRRFTRRLDTRLCGYRCPSSLGSVSCVGVELISFLLIEAYLAKITEFLLYCRFKRDPHTLEEFFRTDIRVVIPEYMDALVATLAPSVATQLQGKMVRPHEFSQMPASCCARIHTLQRADYIIRTHKYYDAEVGRKLLYVLPGALKTIPMSYLLGRNFPFKNSFELFILHVYESGMMTQYIATLREFVALMERNFVTKGSLTLADLLPLFLLVATGWCLSFATFSGEILFITLQQYTGRNYVSKF